MQVFGKLRASADSLPSLGLRQTLPADLPPFWKASILLPSVHSKKKPDVGVDVNQARTRFIPPKPQKNERPRPIAPRRLGKRPFLRHRIPFSF
ncbi:MAG: hypothetical protein U0787_17875 [Polyangia bacterium]